jgi:hypothetical protein
VVEVVPAIHPGFVNLEAWQMHPDASMSKATGSSGDALPDGEVTGNVELELSPSEARRLGEALLDAAVVAELPAFELDGGNISSVETFFEEVSRVLIPDADWGRNLDAFNDILRGGFGTPERGGSCCYGRTTGRPVSALATPRRHACWSAGLSGATRPTGARLREISLSLGLRAAPRLSTGSSRSSQTTAQGGSSERWR